MKLKYPRATVMTGAVFLASGVSAAYLGIEATHFPFVGANIPSLSALFEQTFIENWQLGGLLLMLIVFGWGMLSGEGYDEIEI